MTPEQYALKIEREKNTERIRREKKALPPNPERNLRGIALARKALEKGRKA